MSMPFGLDLGNNSSTLAVARNRGIDIVVNEVSNRSTPSIVGFGPKNRTIGETGKSKQISNVKNTVSNLKRLIGIDYADSDVKTEIEFPNTKLVELDDKEVGGEVRFNGKKCIYSATQIMAMFIDKVKHTVAAETHNAVTDVCIAVPVWYSERQRYSMIDAAKIASLNPVRVVNDVTAAAVSYGVFKTDLPAGEEKARIVAFVDIGHSSYTCSIVSFKKGAMKVLGTAYDKDFGGRDFDKLITEHFADEFKTKYKIDIRTNPKAYMRIMVAAEKLKKVLSANTQAPFNVESVMNDVDVSSQMTREDLETLAQSLLEKINAPVEAALARAKLTAEDIDFVELLGGTTRIPCVNDKLTSVFNKELSSTLNRDEACAKGAAFICALHSPSLRVRPFKFEDVSPYSVSYSWDQQVEDDDNMEVFAANASFPSTKLITLARTGDFKMSAYYTHPEELPSNVKKELSSWDITGVKVPEGQESIDVKVKLRCNASGLHCIEEAYTVEEVTTKEELPLPEDAESDAEPEFKEVTKTVRKDTLEVTAHTFSIHTKRLNEMIEQENELTAQDKLVHETENRKNQLEEYIYTMRSKLDDEYKEFASPEEKERLLKKLEDAQEWLYNDGEDSIKSKYIAKFEELASIGNLIKGRYNQKQEDERQALRKKQEDKQAKEMAEKLAAQRKQKDKEERQKLNAEKKEAKKNKKQHTKKDDDDKDADGDVDMDA